MELTLKRLLEHAEFKKYRGKGYDPTEVDDFLDRAAAMATKVEIQLTQALEQAKANGGAPPQAEPEIEAEIERRVAERIATQPSAPSENELAEQVRRTIVMAQRTADAAIHEARDDAQKLVAEATEKAEALVAEAEARATALRTETDAYVLSTRAEIDDHVATTRAALEAEAIEERRDARRRLAGEIAELEGARETLRSDVNILERHVEEQRTQLGSTLAELQQILDDPSGFRMAPAPALTDPDLPDFGDLDASDDAGDDTEDQPVDSADDAAESDVLDEPPVAEDGSTGSTVGDASDEADDPVAPSPRTALRPAVAALMFDEVDHEAPGLDDMADSGPPTAPVNVVDIGVDRGSEPGSDDDDPFLAELRKAMADDEPLGPRDQAEPSPSASLFEDDDRRGWRFGRR